MPERVYLCIVNRMMEALETRFLEAHWAPRNQTGGAPGDPHPDIDSRSDRLRISSISLERRSSSSMVFDNVTVNRNYRAVDAVW
jgi:hypothetical protein